MSRDFFITALQSVVSLTKSSDLVKTCNKVQELLKKDSIEDQEVVRILSGYLLKFEDAELFKDQLSCVLLALVSESIPLKKVFSNKNFDICNDAEKIQHLEFSIILGLLSDHPDVLQYALKYFEVNNVPPYEVFIHHEDSYNVAPKKRRLLDFRQKITYHHIVKCCYTLLSKLPNELAGKWDWTKFVNNFSSNDNAEIRWMVKECMAILTNMTEAQSKLLAKKLNLTEDEILTNLTIHNQKRPPKVTNTDSLIDLKTPSVINIDGIMLPVYDKVNVHNNDLVPVKSTINNLRSIALAVASGKAISLMGPVGSGKTSLVEHLAGITGRKGIAFKKIQLGDQTDSRMLLGAHQCTDIPGEFVWKPGVLTEAVQNGHWLLLEDIDSAALDVASTLSSLLERNSLCVPGYRDSLPVTPGFQLFVTQRTLITNYGFQKKLSNSSTLLQKHLTQINVEPLSRTELAEIIQKLYPSLASISARMIEVFMMFSVGSHDTSLQTTDLEVCDKGNNVSILRGSRLISTRDLMKWCSRSVVGFDVSSPVAALKVLQDALDIFTCSVSSPENRLELAKKVGTCLGIVETKSEFYCKHHKPNVSLHTASLEVGRAKVQRKEKSLESIDFDNKQVVFSFTRQSACLLERIACCVSSNEPVLLVGETGTGKTSSVQYLARQTGHKLVVINMNQQSDSADLLGGYKPVDLKYVIRPIKNEFEQLFTSFYNIEKNKKFLNHIDTCYDTESWTALMTLMKQSHKAAVSRLTGEKKEKVLKKWMAFGYKLLKLDQQVKAASRLTFAFIEGSLVKAMQEGHWVLLDEINLASAEILECLAGLLEDKNESFDLLEKADKVPVVRHPEFTLFACMNPATDVGKKDLPVGLRNRFTELFIDELTERNDLMLLIGDYLYHMNLSGTILEAIYNFYSTIKKEAKLNLVDGAGNVPHYSLRTLCRALTAAAKAKCGTIARSLYEAFCLSFLTQLDSSSHPKVEAMIARAVVGKKNLKSVLNQMIPEPQIRGQNFLLFEGHWIPQGKLDITIPEGYILTPTVRKNLRDIARIISLGRLPVLLQGDTSVGKTSLITYIGKASGNYCVRINNHEHTDLQEYIGSYATDASGKLVFKEGVLVEAMRKGYWIILDELNLAPSDVLEALNRVLDDNRELFIPETQQVVKADPNFMLFATQNPPGLYGGRKMLSRAFRNRFVELHFDEIPRVELETILHQRCHIPPTYCKKMISVMAELQVRRRGSAAVQGKDGFITLRDLFRWGQRYNHASKEILTDDKFYDWDQHIADEGYLVLAGKVRQPDERVIIEEVIEKNIKRKVCADNLFTLHDATSPVTKHILETILNNQLQEFSHVVWTYNMRRLAVLIAKAFTFNEPVLLVGETGCGKTTICQVLAALKESTLLSVNCHMHTESSDFLGGLRPVRQYKNDGRLFEWMDGPLIKAMESGHMFLADEISLADDSVLERLNSLLEPERQLVLAERGMEESSEIFVITAEKNFHFIGTMNPGGDFGKKELSPALRNRFTEIWCDSVTSREDLLKVLEKSVLQGIALGNQEDGTSGIGSSILDFTHWLKSSEVTGKFPFSIRDLLSWVNFINATVSKGLLDTAEAYVHGACMTFLDCFGTALTGHIDSNTLILLRKSAIDVLLNQIRTVGNEYTESLREMLAEKQTEFTAEKDTHKFGIKPFYIEVGLNMDVDLDHRFTFTAPTTGANTLRLLRGLQLNKAILLEGNPGVGKTSLVTALAKSSGHKVVRINLSDQTDITDLFGTDLPTEDGTFTFKEGAFLSALQNGDWILLDELNLAPQPVLEGLNACLDHRGEVFIPELGMTFKVKEETRLFACQNPLKQGGARRGLPISFLNRFTQVYIDTLTKEDLVYIVESQYPSIPKDILHKIVNFNCKVGREITELQAWGHKGGPWEMNLRDIQRWCEALIKDQGNECQLSPGKFVDMLYINKMRTAEDKEKMSRAYDEEFLPEYPKSDNSPQFNINDKEIVIGDVIIERSVEKCYKNQRAVDTKSLILRSQIQTLKALAQSVKMNWLSILVGSTSTGKSSIVQVLADLTGNNLHVIPVTSAMDVSDLLGGFEQVDYNRNLENLYNKIENITIQTVRNMWLFQNRGNWKSNNNMLTQLHHYKAFRNSANNSNAETKLFNEKLRFLCDQTKKLKDFNKTDPSTMKKLQEVSEEISKLQNKVSKMASVNAGGKFEWIDSLLVKSMIEGSWLLLDNVNLTSSAVLDRLNGLLEPNGVLSILERGEVSEITPNPNFRIFFTVDPKYGEISRAMRNRGVEVFILKPDENNTSETASYLDLKALVSSSGLPGPYHEICLKGHDLMTSYILGLDRPTISHLLQACHLMWQQIVRGIPFKTAFVNSFSDVYIKPRCGGDFDFNVNKSLAEAKNTMLTDLERLVNEEQSCTGKEIKVVDDSHTLTVKGLTTDSTYEISNQLQFVAAQQTVNKNTDEALYGLASLFTSYQKCSKESLYVFYKQLKNSTEENLTRLLNEKAYGIRKEMVDDPQMHQRFYPEQYRIDDNVICISNTNSIVLYNQLLKLTHHINVPGHSLSALDYSKAVLSGNITDDFVEFPILKYCYSYLKLIDEYVKNAVKGAEDSLNDTTVCSLLQLLNWRSRFMKVSSEPIFVKHKGKMTTLNEDIIPLLYTHSKWLQKHLLGELFKLLPTNHELCVKFNRELKNLMISDEENSELAKIGKKVRKLYGQPKLYESQNEYDLCEERSKIYSQFTLDLNQPIEKQMRKFNIDLRTITDKSLAFDVPEANNIKFIQENITKLSEDQKQSAEERLKVKLLPVSSYITLRVLNSLRMHFLGVVKNVDTESVKLSPQPPQNKDLGDMLTHVVEKAKVNSVLSPALLNLLQIIQQLSERDQNELLQRLSGLNSRFWNELYIGLVSSPALHPLPFFDVGTSKDIEEVCDTIANTKRLSLNLPLLPYYVQKMTLTENEDARHVLAYETVSLNDRAEYSVQLGTLRNIIWKNIATLDTTAITKLISDAEFEMTKHEQLVSYLHAVLTSFDSAYTLHEVDETMLQLLKERLPNDDTFVNMIIEADSLHKNLANIYQSVKSDLSRKTEVKILTAELSLLTSIVFSKVMAEVSPVDHVEKYRLKVKYIEEDVRVFDTILSAYYMHGLVSGSIKDSRNIEKASDVPVECFKQGTSHREDLKKVHPYCDVIMKLKDKTAERVHKYASGNTFRPKETSYGSFVKDCKHFTKSVLSPNTVRDLSRNLLSTCNALQHSLQNKQYNKPIVQNSQTVVKESSSWLYSVNAFYKKIDTVYSNAFPDLAKPLLTSLSQLTYSVTALTDLIKELLVKVDQGTLLNEAVTELLIYPNRIPSPGGFERHLNRFVESNFVHILNKKSAVSDDILEADLEFMKVLKMNLLELKMYSTALEKVDKPIFNSVINTLTAVVKAWEKQQRDIERKKIDDEALYVTKSKCEDVDEDAEAYEEMLEMFPSYSESDFAEFKPPNLEQINPKKLNTDIRPKHMISSEDVSLIYRWHSNFIRNMTSAEWLPSQKKLVGNDVISPFLERYSTFSRVIQNGWEALDVAFEGIVSPSLLVLISQIKDKVDGCDDSNSKGNFYRSAWVSETRQCVPLLHRVKDATNVLLDAWPDFPTLKDIMVIVNRILSFPLTSAVSRFLTGLELLRDKIEEWNKNAHKANNMIDISLEVGQQIINWRKLEMAHWKECLNYVSSRKRAEAHKYWFYLYSVIESYLSTEEDNEALTPQRVVNVLKDFIEKSNLAEFEVRLDIIYLYHCHLVHLDKSQRRDELLSIFWNTHNYYSQFSAQVATTIKEKRTPIEKKLKDFVKICTWDRDLSYWSVKDTVQKAHKALHKHTKEFENALKESVQSCLVDKSSESATEHVGIWDRPKRATAAATPTGGAYMIDPQNHLILARNVKKFLDESDLPCQIIPEGSLLCKVPSLLNKAKTLCKDCMTNTGYPGRVQALDDFVTAVIETSTHLGSLEVDSASPKEKQKSQVKNIVQQKRKALADLFRYLSKMGLNYRTGLVILSTTDELYDFTIPPVDLDAAMSYLKSRRCDASLALLWSGCENYFQKNIARHRLLTASLLVPHQDLGIQNIERCKGFAAQLLKLTNSQKKSISKYSRFVCDLRTLATNLVTALEVDATNKNISTIKQKLDILCSAYANSSVLLEQFSVVLKSIPEQELGAEFEPDFDNVLSKSPIVKSYKHSEEWNKFYRTIQDVKSSVSKQKTLLNKLAVVVPKEIGQNIEELPIISQAHIDTIEDAKNNLSHTKVKIDNLIAEYQIELEITEKDFVPQHPVLRSVVDLSNYLKESLEQITKTDEINDATMEDPKQIESELTSQTEDLVATMLLVIQSIYKKHLPQDKNNENCDVLDAIDEIIDDGKPPEESNEILEDNHLKELLHEKLTSDVKMLQLDALIQKLYGLLAKYIQYLATIGANDEVRSVVMRLVPILEQTVLFVQYFVTQKVAVHRVSCKMLAVLLKIFSDLATKGFCKPSDLDMEDGDGEGGPGKMSAGTGLGEGEGQKDVSERIENQDQLDDAHRPGEEKKEEERDCKEEEKGVNMTDDFDSHLQDVDKKGDESDREDDENDPDKQMGDLDNAAEKLDQQIWGSEDEEEDNEDPGKSEKEDDKGKGESTGEKEMSAKQEEKGQDDGSDGKDKKKKKDINEMEEPELDDDQVDPYHGNHQPLPEPEDFELPDNMDLDGQEPKEDEDGETETENPFDIDVMKENIPEEGQEDPDEGKEDKDNRNGLDVSSDEDDAGEDGGEQETEKKDKDNEQNDNGDEKQDAEDDEKPEEGDQGMEEDAQAENPEATPETGESPEDNANEELPKNPDNINEDDEVEQKNQEANPQANPSNNDPTAEEKTENAEMNSGTDDNVETNAEQNKDEEAAPKEQGQEQVGEDVQSTGRSELDKSEKGHRGERQATSRSEQSAQDNEKKRDNKPGRTDEQRTLGEINEEKHKQSRTLNVEREDQSAEDGGDNDEDAEKEADAFQHVKQANKDDLQAIDAATKEQADQQPTLQKDEDEDAEKLKDDEELPMDVDDDELQVEKSDELKPEKMKEGAEREKDKSGKKNEGGEEPTGETGIEVEGEKVSTTLVPRGSETTYQTRLVQSQDQAEEISREQYMSFREWLCSVGSAGSVTAGAVWRALWQRTAGDARALCERLRLILEPTGRSRRAGDFRTGRAINMRRVIPYIASQFRKDRIWLRRTKPAKREYKIAIAVDDSSSMADNRSKELAFESLALVSQALNLLESGDLAVLSFGERPNLLHPFTEQFSEHSGSKILEQLRFEQTKTKIAQLLDFCTVLFEEQSMRSDAINAKLLVVVSDGRGIFSEGETKVVQAVRRARQQGVFLVYVIIDNPDNKDSIMDIRRPLLDPITNKLTFEQYLDAFPFPFYLILRDMSALPTVLGDALRQWFELAANTAS